MYLIYEAWSNDMENEPDSAFGYKEIGYVFTEEETEKFKDEELPEDFSWVIRSDKRVGKRFLIKKINYLGNYHVNIQIDRGNQVKRISGWKDK